MVASTLMLTKEVVPEKVDLNALVREGKRIQKRAGTTPEDTLAFKLFYQAAAARHAEAQYLVSDCYHFGNGVEKDSDETLKWLLKSAEAGFAAAQSSLGSCYEYKYLVPHDLVKALRWYQKAAEQDFGLGQNRLGRFFLQGEGVPRDLIQAYKWLKLADEKGAGVLRNEASVLAAPLMTHSQIEAAEALYAEFKNKHVIQRHDTKL